MRSEFQFIHHIKEKYSLGKIGDDCAVLPKDNKTDVVLTSDMLVEDIDFRLSYADPRSIGHKALAVSLSDIAAMGGTPKWALLSIGITEKLWEGDFLDEFYAGWHDLAAKFQVELVGGDISKTPDKIVIDSTIGGEVPRGKAVLRSGAKPGDSIFVTGPLGGAAGGLRLLENGVAHSDEIEWRRDLVEKQLRPSASLFGITIRELGASSMIDISDGLSSDLAHICAASGVGARLFADKIPVDQHLVMHGIDASEQLDLALNGGEDLELLFTIDEKNISAGEFTQFFRIGEVTATVEIIELIHPSETVRLRPHGYVHF